MGVFVSTCININVNKIADYTHCNINVDNNINYIKWITHCNLYQFKKALQENNIQVIQRSLILNYQYNLVLPNKRLTLQQYTNSNSNYNYTPITELQHSPLYWSFVGGNINIIATFLNDYQLGCISSDEYKQAIPILCNKLTNNYFKMHELFWIMLSGNNYYNYNNINSNLLPMFNYSPKNLYLFIYTELYEIVKYYLCKDVMQIVINYCL